MKKFKVLRTPIRMADLSFDDFYDDEAVNLRAEQLRAKAVRRFRRQQQTA